jgi:hypothetical protein
MSILNLHNHQSSCLSVSIIIVPNTHNHANRIEVPNAGRPVESFCRAIKARGVNAG